MRKTQSKVYWRWVCSYVVILLLPMFLCLAIFTQSREMIAAEVREVNLESLRRTQTLTDASLTEVKATLNLLVADPRVQAIAHNEGAFTAYNYLSMSQIQEQLIRYVSVNQNLKNLFIYFAAQQYTINQDGCYTLSELRSYFDVNGGPPSERFIRMQESGKESGLCRIADERTGERHLYLFQSVAPAVSTRYGKTLVIAELNAEKLFPTENSEDTRSFVWLDAYPDYEVLEAAGFTRAQVDGLLSGGESASVVQDKKLLVTVASQTKLFHSVVLISLRKLMEKPNRLQMVFFVLFFFSLAIGSALVWTFARRQYRPLNKLIELLPRASQQKGGRLDEYRYLEERLSDVYGENRNYESRLRQQESAMRKVMLGRILRGRVRSMESVDESLRLHGIQFPSHEFVVTQLTLQSMELTEGAEQSEEREFELTHFIIQNVFEELVRARHCGYLIDMDGAFAMVACRDPEASGDFEDAMYAAACEVVRVLKENFRVELFAAVSGVHFDAMGLAACYDEVTEMTQYAELVEAHAPVMRYSAFNTSGENADAEVAMAEGVAHFSLLVQQGAYEQAMAFFDSLIDQYLQMDLNSLNVAKCRMFGLINQLVLAFEGLKGQVDAQLLEELDPANRLIGVESIAQLKQEMRALMEAITSRLAAQDGDSTQSRAQQVMHYIDLHYADPNLSATLVADELGVNLTYLSRVFKKQTGIGMLAYIHQVRIEKAKDLMRHTGDSIKTIAQKVGYSSSMMLIRAFKRYEGVTPGQYRGE